MEHTILEKLGLTKNESAIFMALVLKGTLSATDIAHQTGLNRPYVYYALDRLLEKGYISQISVKGKKNFKAMESTHILSLEEHKLSILDTFMKDLESKKQESKEDISVEVLKGKSVVKNIFNLCLSEIKPRQEMLSIGIDEDKMEFLEPIYLRRVLNHFKERLIGERIILKEGGRKLSYAATTNYRFLSAELIGNTAKLIYQDRVIELLYGEPLYAIVIKNSSVAETARRQFEVFWKMAKR